MTDWDRQALAESNVPSSHSSRREITVLLVDDDRALLELTEERLERADDSITTVAETRPRDALERIETGEIDCIVSDYEMPDMDGLTLLEAVRVIDDELPFILFTGKGSEEIAAEAISAGVTDYLQKGTGADQYTVLANRIENAVSQYRAEKVIDETTRWYSTILEHSTDYVMIVDANGMVSYVTPPIEKVMGYPPRDIIGDTSFDFAHPDDVEGAAETLFEIIEDPTVEKTVEFRAQHADGSWRWLEVRGRNLLDDPVIGGILVNVRDITKRKAREQSLQRQAERFEKLTSFLTHDLRNQVNVLEGRLQLAAADHDSDDLEKAVQTSQRIEQMVDSFAELADKGTIPTDPDVVSLSTVATQAWEDLMPEEATLLFEGEMTVTADEDRLRSVFENLFQNAKTHVGPAVTVTVGRMDDADGFYVEDDGPGISEDRRDAVFRPGHSTARHGKGMGLAIVGEVAEAHGWTVTITDGSMGGARFEFEVGRE